MGLAKTLKKIFKAVAIGGLLTFSGAVMAEPIVLVLGHFNSGGLAFMEAAAPWLNMVFDSIGITDGLHTLSEMIPTPEIEATLPGGGIELSTNATPPVDAINEALSSLEIDW